MKYAKEIGSYPWYKRAMCISYKKWKKRGPVDGWEYMLFFDFIFTPMYKDINLKTVYKICKRFEKRYSIDAMSFYTRFSKIFSTNARETYFFP